jgi:hypothetical protein
MFGLKKKEDNTIRSETCGSPEMELVDITEQSISKVQRIEGSFWLKSFPKAMDVERGIAAVRADDLSNHRPLPRNDRTTVIAILVVLIGFIAAAIFVGYGTHSAISQQEVKFRFRAEELAFELEGAWDEYESASRWLFQACGTHNISRHDFVDIYEYLTVTGLDVEVSYSLDDRSCTPAKMRRC